MSNLSHDTATQHEVSVKNRKIMDLTGIKKVDHFDATQFLLETTMGFLIIRGNGLEMKGFDKQKGTVNIQGTVDAWMYQDELPVEKSKSFFRKLFK